MNPFFYFVTLQPFIAHLGDALSLLQKKPATFFFANFFFYLKKKEKKRTEQNRTSSAPLHCISSQIDFPDDEGRENLQ